MQSPVSRRLPLTHVLHSYPYKFERTIASTGKPFTVGHKGDKPNVGKRIQNMHGSLKQA